MNTLDRIMNVCENAGWTTFPSDTNPGFMNVECDCQGENKMDFWTYTISVDENISLGDFADMIKQKSEAVKEILDSHEAIHDTKNAFVDLDEKFNNLLEDLSLELQKDKVRDNRGVER